MYDVNLVEVLTLAAALYAAVMGHRLQRRFDVLYDGKSLRSPRRSSCRQGHPASKGSRS